MVDNAGIKSRGKIWFDWYNIVGDGYVAGDAGKGLKRQPPKWPCFPKCD